jgi:hypothetical protein
VRKTSEADGNSVEKLEAVILTATDHSPMKQAGNG